MGNEILDKLLYNILDIGFYVGDAQLLIEIDDGIWKGKSAKTTLKNIESASNIKTGYATSDSIYDQLELFQNAFSKVENVKNKYNTYSIIYRAYIDKLNQQEPLELKTFENDVSLIKSRCEVARQEAENAAKEVNNILGTIKSLNSLTELSIKEDVNEYYINLDRATPDIVSGCLNKMINICDEIKSDLNATAFNNIPVTIELGGTRRNYVEAPNRTITTNLYFGSARKIIQSNLEKLKNFIKKIKIKSENHISYISKFENNEDFEIYAENTSSTTTPETKKEPIKYTVKRGDTLIAIASVYGITWQELYNANKSNKNALPNGDYKQLVVGENLVIPGQYNEVVVEVEKTAPLDTISNNKLPEIDSYKFNNLESYSNLSKMNWAVNVTAIDMENLTTPMLIKNVGGDIKMIDKNGDAIVISDSFYGKNGHRGTDFIGGEYDYGTNIHALGPGIVIGAANDDKWNQGYGNYVRILHETEENGEIVYIESIYEHLAEVNVQPGDVIDGSEPIGTMGSTGNSSGVHLHMEVTKVPLTEQELAGKNATEVLSYVKQAGIDTAHTYEDGYVLYDIGKYYKEKGFLEGDGK